MLMILAGLPGSGKTTLAKEIARDLRALHLRIDHVEQAIKTSSLAVETAAEAGYLVGYALAEDNLRLNLPVIANSVNPLELTRRAWHDVANRVACPFVDIEVVCSDRTEHRRRVETRRSDIPGLQLPTWQQVQARDYEPWSDPPLVIDTAGKTPQESVAELRERLPRMAPMAGQPQAF